MNGRMLLVHLLTAFMSTLALSGHATCLIESNGVLVPEHRSLVAAGVEGTVDSIDVSMGEHVEKGQVLAALKVEPYEYELALARIAQDQARAEYASGKAQMGALEDRYRRWSAGLDAGAVTDEAMRELAVEIDIGTYEIEVLKAKLASSDIEVRKAEYRMERVQARAPFDGHVLDSKVSPGDYVHAGSPLLNLVSSRRHVDLTVSIAQGQAIERGQPVGLTVSGRGQACGTLDAIAAELQPATGAMVARVVLPDKLWEDLPIGTRVSACIMPKHDECD
jgi:RND family efflux transporter MFP subunit